MMGSIMSFRRITIVTLAFLAVLTGCNLDDSTKAIELNKDSISEIRGVSQQSDPVTNIILSEDKAESLITQFNSSGVRKTNQEVEKKGWLYSFSIIYDNGDIVNIQLSEEGMAIDGLICSTEKYNLDDYAILFQ